MSLRKIKERRVRAHNGIIFWVSESNYRSLVRNGLVVEMPDVPVKKAEKPKPRRTAARTTTRKRTQMKSAGRTTSEQ